MFKSLKKNWHLFLFVLVSILYFAIKILMLANKQDTNIVLKKLDDKSKKEREKIENINKELNNVNKKKVNKKNFHDYTNISLVNLFRRNLSGNK